MKNLIFLLFVLFNIHDKESHELTISITNVADEYLGKNIYVGYWLSDNPDFPEVEKVDFKEADTITSKNYKIKKLLDTNRYAVSIFVDMNGNGKLDKNLLGIPKEPYCLSNNVKPKFSQPDFDDCSFELNKDKTLELKLIY